MNKLIGGYARKNIIFVILGCIICSYIIYIRLFLERLDKSLFVNINKLDLIIYFDLFIIFTFYSLIIIYYLYKEKYPPKRTLKNKVLIKIKYYFQYVSIYFSKIYNDSIKFFELFIRKTLIEDWLGQEMFFYNLLIPFRKIFSYYPGFKVYIWTIRIFILIPKCLMLIILGTDIFVFEKLHYFYLLMPIYLIPLIYKYIIHVMACTAHPYFYDINKKLIYTIKSTNKDISCAEYHEMLVNCTIPYKDGFAIYNIEKYNNIPKPLDVGFTKEYIEYLSKLDYTFTEEDVKEIRKQLQLFKQKYSDVLMIIQRLLGVEEKIYTREINLIILIGYAISWGYVFIRSAYIFFYVRIKRIF